MRAARVATGSTSIKNVESDDCHRLGILLARARRRVEESIPHSPDWEAAIEALDELEQATLQESDPVLAGDAA